MASNDNRTCTNQDCARSFAASTSTATDSPRWTCACAFKRSAHCSSVTSHSPSSPTSRTRTSATAPSGRASCPSRTTVFPRTLPRAKRMAEDYQKEQQPARSPSAPGPSSAPLSGPNSPGRCVHRTKETHNVHLQREHAAASVPRRVPHQVLQSLRGRVRSLAWPTRERVRRCQAGVGQPWSPRRQAAAPSAPSPTPTGPRLRLVNSPSPLPALDGGAPPAARRDSAAGPGEPQLIGVDAGARTALCATGPARVTHAAARDDDDRRIPHAAPTPVPHDPRRRPCLSAAADAQDVPQLLHSATGRTPSLSPRRGRRWPLRRSTSSRPPPGSDPSRPGAPRPTSPA